ncbi:hypothetical protein DFJ74DRAFT_643962 [Hyaloraphidium curvatum]|nr:hypothetical protein DFJ74DRAFT_643962 [Hyaloraphidium curvatum]
MSAAPAARRVRIPRARVPPRPASAPPAAMLHSDSEDERSEPDDAFDDGGGGPVPAKDDSAADGVGAHGEAGAGEAADDLPALVRAAVGPSSAGVLDLRPPAEFAAARLVRSVGVPELREDRLVELPNRYRRFAAVVPRRLPSGDHDAATRANLDFLAKQRYAPSPVIEVPPRTDPDHAAFWARVPPELRAQGRSWHTLFRPTPGLERLLGSVERGLASRFGPGPQWDAVDLGSGAGRDALFLLARGTPAALATDAPDPPPLRPWAVTAVDHLPRALLKASALIARHLGPLWTPASAARFRPVHAEFRRDGSVRHYPPSPPPPTDAPLPPRFDARAYHLVTASRFLPPRPFWPSLLRMVRPGGYLLMCTFVEGTYHPTSPDHFLYRGEMRAFLERAGGWTVLEEEEESTEEGKRVVVFLARRS